MDTKKKHQISAWVGIILALIYTFVPTDFVPDFVPVAGWLDDLVAIALAVSNAIRVAQKYKNNDGE